MEFPQINKMINLIKKFGDHRYELRAIRHPDKPASHNYTCTDTYLTRSILKKLEDYNSECKAIYFRPMSPQFIMIDIDNKKYNLKKEDELKKSRVLDFNPFMIIETSKKKFQAWYYIKSIKSWDMYIEVGKNLNEVLNGDEKSIKSRQVGRLPDFENFKYNNQKGFLVDLIYLKLKYSKFWSRLNLIKAGYINLDRGGGKKPTNRYLEKANKITNSKGMSKEKTTKTVKTSNRPKLKNISKDWTQKEKDQYFKEYFKNDTPSQITNMFDFSLACKIFENEPYKSVYEVENIIKANSRSPDKNIPSYISNTVRNARKRVLSKK